MNAIISSSNYIDKYKTHQKQTTNPVSHSVASSSEQSKYTQTKKEINTSIQQQEKGNNKKIIAGLTGFVILGSIYIGGKKGYLGNRIKRIFSKESSNVTNSINNADKDVLNYDIKPPKISDLKASEEAIKRSQYSPLEAEYDKIRQDIERNPDNQARFTEIIANLRASASEINHKFKSIDSKAKEYDGGVMERAIFQKRYFSIPANKQEGYCCKDPLLYKEAREEALDIQTGYYLLEPYQNAKRNFFDNKINNTDLLEGLRKRYTQINSEDNKFIDECIEKLNSESALCCGKSSKLHAYELARFGKIFREAMNISVK